MIVRLSVHCGLPPEVIRIAFEVFLPVRITQDYRRNCAGGDSLLGAKKAPQQRLHAERLKVVAGHILVSTRSGLLPCALTPSRLSRSPKTSEIHSGFLPQFPILRQRQAWLPESPVCSNPISATLLSSRMCMELKKSPLRR